MLTMKTEGMMDLVYELVDDNDEFIQLIDKDGTGSFIDKDGTGSFLGLTHRDNVLGWMKKESEDIEGEKVSFFEDKNFYSLLASLTNFMGFAVPNIQHQIFDDFVKPGRFAIELPQDPIPEGIEKSARNKLLLKQQLMFEKCKLVRQISEGWAPDIEVFVQERV